MATCSNLTSGFIDLATYDELEKYLYGGSDATAYFVRETRKATWFTQVPVVLARASGQPEFGNEWSVTISRAGDYLLNTWLRVIVPDISFDKDYNTLEDSLIILKRGYKVGFVCGISGFIFISYMFLSTDIEDSWVCYAVCGVIGAVISYLF